MFIPSTDPLPTIDEHDTVITSLVKIAKDQPKHNISNKQGRPSIRSNSFISI